MTDPSRVRNFAVLIILCAIFTIPAIFMERGPLLDSVSFLMLLFGGIGLWQVSGEAWGAFWSGSRDRYALGLYGLFALFLSVVLMRTYGITTRNNVSANMALETTHVYAALVFIQFAGLLLFTRGASAPAVAGKRTRWGQLIGGILIGALLTSSKFLEPVLMFFSKLFSRIF